MPSLQVHCAISKKRTGNDFEELHQWIDNPSKDLGSDHRIYRHAYTEDEAQYIKNYWDDKGPELGDKAVIEWLFHIALDNLSTAFKMSKNIYGDLTFNFMQFGLSRTDFIYCDFERLDEEGLKEYFGTDSFVEEAEDSFLTGFLKKIFG